MPTMAARSDSCAQECIHIMSWKKAAIRKQLNCDNLTGIACRVNVTAVIDVVAKADYQNTSYSRLNYIHILSRSRV